MCARHVVGPCIADRSNRSEGGNRHTDGPGKAGAVLGVVVIIRACILLFALAALAACRTLETEVSTQAHLPVGQPVVTVESNQKLMLPAEFGVLNPPAFPVAPALTGAMAKLVCLSFTVDEGGAVVDVRPESFPAEPCVDSERPESSPFIDAAIDAVEQWEFLAAAVCTFDSVAAARESDAECTGAAQVQPIPVRLAWKFLFTADREGRQRVSIRP